MFRVKNVFDFVLRSQLPFPKFTKAVWISLVIEISKVLKSAYEFLQVEQFWLPFQVDSSHEEALLALPH